jgi:hypothetical protein
MQLGNGYFYDQAALIERLTIGVQRSDQSVIFLVGSPITAPSRAGEPGIPGVNGVIDIIRNEFADPEQLAEFEKAIRVGQRTIIWH